MPHARDYIVVSRRQETPTTATLSLAPMQGPLPMWRPGQCLTVYFPDLSETLGKLYSISSAPSEGILTITVKGMGRFSNRLCALKEGDCLLASLPHGTFMSDTAGPLVLVAGGMGITPFRGMLIEAAASLRPVVRLLYSAKYACDMPFSEALAALAEGSSTVTLERFTTKGLIVTPGVKNRRMRTEDILHQTPEDAHYLISGSLSFVLGIRNELRKSGIPRADILTEVYF